MKRIIPMALATMAVFSALASAPAFAATSVESVRLSIVPDEDEYMSPGDVEYGMEPIALDGEYYVDEYDSSASDPEPKKSYTYTIDILPDDGYAFTDTTKVSVYGAVETTVKSRSSSKITVRVKTYPYHVLAEPSNIQINTEAKEVTWDAVNYAKKYSVIVYYRTNGGDERQTTKSVTSTKLSLSGYIGKYEDVNVAVRAVKGNTDGDRFIANSDYVKPDGTIDEENSDEEYKFSIPSASSDGSSSSESASTGSSSQSSQGSQSGQSSQNGQSGQSGPGFHESEVSSSASSSETASSIGPESDEPNGWHGSENLWYYVNDGHKIAGWLNLNGEWYLFNSKGEMLYGWQYVDDAWYWLNTEHDGTFGKMASGWKTINGTTYYLNEGHDGAFGAMYANRSTPDGRYADANGAVR